MAATIALSTAATAAGAYFGSERRAKTNIVQVGTRSDGLNVYDFDYREGFGPSGRQRGVMREEVAELRPDALGPRNAEGVLTVNYAVLSDEGL